MLRRERFFRRTVPLGSSFELRSNEERTAKVLGYSTIPV
jgi:hypothetical protein